MSSPKRRILCAEPHGDTCAMILLLLELQGYEVRSVETIAESLELMAKEPFDLCLLSDTYPDGTGIELCQRLHRLRPLTPIVFFSAAVYEWNIRAGMNAGAQAYIPKPGDIDELVETVRHLLSHQKSSTSSEELLH